MAHFICIYINKGKKAWKKKEEKQNIKPNSNCPLYNSIGFSIVISYVRLLFFVSCLLYSPQFSFVYTWIAVADFMRRVSVSIFSLMQSYCWILLLLWCCFFISNLLSFLLHLAKFFDLPLHIFGIYFSWILECLSPSSSSSSIKQCKNEANRIENTHRPLRAVATSLFMTLFFFYFSSPSYFVCSLYLSWHTVQTAKWIFNYMIFVN